MENYGMDKAKLNKLKEVVYNHFDIERDFPIDSVNQDNLEVWSSSMHLSLIMEIESYFKVAFKIDEVTEMHSFDDIVYYLSKKGI